MSRPSNMIVPAVGSISRVTIRPVVVLPQPDSPTSDEVSPGAPEVEAVDRLHGADLPLEQARDREVLHQAGDRQQLVRSGRSAGALVRSRSRGVMLTAWEPPPRPKMRGVPRGRGGSAQVARRRVASSSGTPAAAEPFRAGP